MAWPKGVPRNKKENEVAATMEQQIDRELVADITPSTGQNDLVNTFLAAMRQMRDRKSVV